MSAVIDDTTPRVWLGCMSCYNEGNLVGEWFDASDAASIPLSQIHAINSVTAPDHEELWCLDHENIPVDGELSPTSAIEWARVLDEVSPEDRPALCAWVKSGDYVAEAMGELPSISDFTDRYVGHFEDFRTYALEYAEDIGLLVEIPDHLWDYFDWDQWVTDFEQEHLVCQAGYGQDGIDIFRYC